MAQLPERLEEIKSHNRAKPGEGSSITSKDGFNIDPPPITHCTQMSQLSANDLQASGASATSSSSVFSDTSGGSSVLAESQTGVARGRSVSIRDGHWSAPSLVIARNKKKSPYKASIQNTIAIGNSYPFSHRFTD